MSEVDRKSFAKLDSGYPAFVHSGLGSSASGCFSIRMQLEGLSQHMFFLGVGEGGGGGWLILMIVS